MLVRRDSEALLRRFRLLFLAPARWDLTLTFKDLDASPMPKEAEGQPKIFSSEESTLLDTQNPTGKSGQSMPPSNSKDAHLSEIELPQRKQSFTDFSTPPAKVSAFCRAVLCAIIPEEFWGTGEVGGWNKRVMMRNVDRFIRLRRFESLALHEVLQGLKVC
jgi:hypothetical protein